MSCALMWASRRQGKSVGDSTLRDAIIMEFGERCVLDMNAIQYLRGLRAAHVEGADELIRAIEKYDEIDLYLEC